jgi:hypothetical protein
VVSAIFVVEALALKGFFVVSAFFVVEALDLNPPPKAAQYHPCNICLDRATMR